MAMRLRYAAAPSPSTTSFARHLNRWLHHLSDKIKNGLGLLIPPSMTWEGGDDYDDGSGDDIPMEFYFFDELIVRGIRGIDQKRRPTRQTPTRNLKRLSKTRLSPRWRTRKRALATTPHCAVHSFCFYGVFLPNKYPILQQTDKL